MTGVEFFQFSVFSCGSERLSAAVNVCSLIFSGEKKSMFEIKGHGNVPTSSI